MGIWIIAGVTFREAARKKMLWMALAAGGAFLMLFGTGLHFQAKSFTARGMNPVLRREIAFTMLTTYIAIMVGGVNAIAYVIAGVTARHVVSGLLLMWMESVVLLSVTFALA